MSDRETGDRFHTSDGDGELHPVLDLAVDQSQAAEAAATLNDDIQLDSTSGDPLFSEDVVWSIIILPLERHTFIQRAVTPTRPLERDQTTA